MSMTRGCVKVGVSRVSRREGQTTQQLPLELAAVGDSASELASVLAT